MNFMRFVSLCALTSGAFALTTDSSFEPPNFNVTAALVANGVNPEFIPDSTALTERSSLGACNVAVCFLVISISCAITALTQRTVQLSADHFRQQKAIR